MRNIKLLSVSGGSIFGGQSFDYWLKTLCKRCGFWEVYAPARKSSYRGTEILASDPRIIEGVIDSATREQKERVKELTANKKVLQDKLSQVDNKAKNLIGVLGEGERNKQLTYILKELEELDTQAKQLRGEIESIEFESADLENKIVSGDIIKKNFVVFRDIYDFLTDDEKFDLLHLLIKRIVYFEDAKPGQDDQRKGQIKMDLWELPPINPSKKNSAKGFAESHVWLPRQDSNLRHGG